MSSDNFYSKILVFGLIYIKIRNKFKSFPYDTKEYQATQEVKILIALEQIILILKK